VVLTSLKFYLLSDRYKCKSEVANVVYLTYQIWHTHPLAPNLLFQVDILVVHAIVSSCISLKHLITYWNPCAWSCYIYCGFIKVNHMLAWF
jgi:hypothetical protein